MDLSRINKLTYRQYGFRVFDWDDNRGEGDDAGKVVVGKVDLNTVGWEQEFENIPPPLASRIRNSGLDVITNQAIANLFNTIFEKFRHTEYNGKKHVATSLHVRGTYRPFLFILGNEVRENEFLPPRPQSLCQKIRNSIKKAFNRLSMAHATRTIHTSNVGQSEIIIDL